MTPSNGFHTGVAHVQIKQITSQHCYGMPDVGLMVMVVGLGSSDPEFKSCSAVELTPGGVDSACHPSEGWQNECQLAGILCRSGDPSRIVPNSQGDC